MLLQLAGGFIARIKVRTDPICRFNTQAVARFPHRLMPCGRAEHSAGQPIAGPVTLVGTAARQVCRRPGRTRPRSCCREPAPRQYCKRTRRHGELPRAAPAGAAGQLPRAAQRADIHRFSARRGDHRHRLRAGRGDRARHPEIRVRRQRAHLPSVRDVQPAAPASKAHSAGDHPPDWDHRRRRGRQTHRRCRSAGAGCRCRGGDCPQRQLRQADVRGPLARVFREELGLLLPSDPLANGGSRGDEARLPGDGLRVLPPRSPSDR